MQRRKKPLKSAFVVTLSVAAAAAASLVIGCGGKVPSDGIGSSGSSGSSNNPPGTITTCTSATNSGDPCFASETNGCTSQTVGPLVCRDGTWVTDNIAITNPPPPPRVCPPTEPIDGSYCASNGNPPCTYTDGCDSRPDTAPVYRLHACVGSAWKRTSATYIAACPAALPRSGDSCASCADSYPAQCTYPSGTPCPGPSATCDPKTLTWNLSVSTCNPPAPIDAGAGGNP